MSVQEQNSVQYFEGPIIIGTTLPINEFTFIDNSHVSAKIRGESTNWVYGTDYTISGAGTSVRTITLLKAVAADEILAVFLEMPITQDTSPEEGGNFPAAVQEMSLDKLTYICQMLYGRITRAVQVSIDSNFDGLLYDSASQSGKAIIINELGTGLTYSTDKVNDIMALVRSILSQVQTLEGNASTSASTATTQAGIATTKAAEAAVSASNAAALANFHASIENLTPALEDEIITYDASMGNYKKATLENAIKSVPQISYATLPFTSDAKNVIPVYTPFSNVSTAVYASKLFSAASQVVNIPYGLFFSSDGLKMFLIGSSYTTVYQYALSTAWDVSTAVYASKSFSVASQESSPRSLFFSPDGLKMFILGIDSRNVYQYTLSTAWDVSTAVYASKAFSVVSQDTSPRALFFSPDGLKMFLIGSTHNTVYQYTLSTAWDVSTAVYASKAFSVASQSVNPYGLFFSSDGLKLLLVDGSYDIVYQYTLSTAWDVSTAVYTSNSFSVASQCNNPRGLFFSPDNLKMFVVAFSSKAVYQYTLSQYSTTILDYANLYAPIASAISTTIATAGIYVGVSSSSIVTNIAGTSFTWSNGVGTCIKAGVFDIKYRASLACVTASQQLAMCIFKNNVKVNGSDASTWETVASKPWTVNAEVPITFAVGDTVQLAVTDFTAIYPVLIDCLGFNISRRP